MSNYLLTRQSLMASLRREMAKQEANPAVLPRRDASLLLAARLTNDLYALKSNDKAALRLMLLTNLEWAKIVAEA